METKTFKFYKYSLIALFFAIIVYPLISLLINIKYSDILNLIHSNQFVPMIVNSLIVTLSSTIISTLLAFSLSYVIARTNVRFKTIFPILFTIPMLIPSISHGMGLVLLFGSNGIITNMFNWNFNIYGYTGMILGSVLYSFPVAFLMFNNALKYEDFTLYEAADCLGLNSFQKFKEITLPNMKKTLISVIFAVFTMVFTDYGVPLTIGGKVITLPHYMYREVIGLHNFSKGAVIGIILLIPAVIAFVVDLKKDDSKSASTITKEFKVKENKKRDIFAYSYLLIVLFLLALPLLAFAFLSFVKKYPIDLSLTFDNIKKVFNSGALNYLENSLLIALGTSLVGVVLIYVCAFITARSQKKFSTLFLHFMSMVSLAIPGIVLGLCYVLAFNGSFFYGTIVILIMVNITHFFASPYLTTYNSFEKFNSNLEDVAVTMGISKTRMLLDVFVPCTRETILENFSFLFTNAMITISAVSFLSNFKNLPLALLIPQLESQALIEATSFISILILAINLFVKLIIYIMRRYLSSRGEL